ncbi:MAG: hypothetical protein MAG581_02038 [Deltaproteobacteria bacterium]|nr:hypothetical protein [Deltaproteobacteria bacterium]
MIAPMSMLLSSGSPTLSFAILVLRRLVTFSATLSCTKRREPAQQTCPWLNQIASTRPSMALSRSASSKTINGDLPPSSRVSFLSEFAVCSRISLPISVEPVKAIFFKSGCFTISEPVSPGPVITFKTPGGSPI